jgi:hypothetical protein
MKLQRQLVGRMFQARLAMAAARIGTVRALSPAMLMRLSLTM